MTAKQIALGFQRTGYRIGQRVEIMAGSSSPMARGVVVGYGRKTGSGWGVRIKRDCLKALETWPVSLIRPTSNQTKR